MPTTTTTSRRNRAVKPRPVAGVGEASDVVRELTKKQEQAALLIAEDELTQDEIAAAVGITRQALYKWRQRPEFAALVGEYTGQLQAGMLRLSIAKKRERLKVLNDLHTRSLRVIADRAARYSAELVDDSPDGATRRFFGNATPPEAATGLLARQEAMNPKGQLTVNWSVDTGLMKEIRDLHKQAAQELGQWVEKAENTQHVEVTMMIERVADQLGLDPDEIRAEAERFLQAAT